jgi:hypothetical protein
MGQGGLMDGFLFAFYLVFSVAPKLSVYVAFIQFTVFLGDLQENLRDLSLWPACHVILDIFFARTAAP